MYEQIKPLEIELWGAADGLRANSKLIEEATSLMQQILRGTA